MSLLRTVGVLIVMGCASSTPDDSAFSNVALAGMATDSGKYFVEFRTAPTQPPTRGAATVDLVVRDRATNAPVDGLAIEVIPWMVAHDHGTSVIPTVTPRSDGHYLVSNVGFFMPGAWQLRTTISGSDHVAPSIDIP
jgi:hypothetical protein